jgi:DNA polymerase
MPVKPPSKEELDACRRCRLGEIATQGVPGEGPRSARLMLVGEQPGDEEDQKGHPFVGPAGRLLRSALEHAGIDDDAIYVTNAVKHFSFELRGKRRIHKTPAQREVAACHAWLEQELAAIKPSVIVALGATALGAVMGSASRSPRPAPRAACATPKACASSPRIIRPQCCAHRTRTEGRSSSTSSWPICGAQRR